MKKFITIVISCSLALAAGALAQQPQEDEQQPLTGKKQTGKAHPAKDAQAPAKARAERPATKPNAARKAKEQAPATDTAQAAAPEKEQANPNPKAQAGRQKKGRNAKKAETAKAPASATQSETQASDASQANQPKAEAAPVAPQANQSKAKAAPAAAQANQSKAEAAPAAAQANQPNPRANRRPGQPAKKPDVKVVQKIKEQHVNFHAQARPDRVPTVTFSQTRRIEGSDRWQGSRYEVFRAYRPERHDEHFYRSRYSRVELIGGGYYYYNQGYWYPAWGYNPSQQYYAYDGPIYAGAKAEPPDKVIADVQAVLQEQGYYTGEVDGLLGPLTRQALTGYQTDNGLYTTATIDEPTLDSLGMG